MLQVPVSENGLNCMGYCERENERGRLKGQLKDFISLLKKKISNSEYKDQGLSIQTLKDEGFNCASGWTLEGLSQLK